MKIFLSALIALCSWSADKYCYVYQVCADKGRIVLDVNTTSRLVLNLKIQNNRNSKITLNDSVVILFYGFNQNLRQPYHDSINSSNYKLVLYVPQSDPISVIQMKLEKPLVIKSQADYSLILKKQLLEQTVKLKGNIDNRYQLNTGFQLFLISTLGNQRKIHLASNIFTTN
ncbi:MAG: hypothetical protein IT214_00935 [Chitinophagaceae bacterium]|nr:hypothetical protein [Chitinophagaceae bacterium]